MLLVGVAEDTELDRLRVENAHVPLSEEFEQSVR